MYLINETDQILEHFYTSDDRWLDDISYFIKTNFQYTVNGDNPIDAMDTVCAHLLYWYYESLEHNLIAQEIYNEYISKSHILQKINQNNDPNPELIIYEFNGTSIYDEINDENIIPSKDFKSFKFAIHEKGYLYISRSEFDDMRGEIILPEDDEDEIEIYFSNSDVYFFISEQNQNELLKYMKHCLKELNLIYSKLNLQQIEIK